MADAEGDHAVIGWDVVLSHDFCDGEFKAGIRGGIGFRGVVAFNWMAGGVGGVFIASSKNPNESIHGKGFVARLSGSTIEFISMWKLIFFGRNLFRC